MSPDEDNSVDEQIIPLKGRSYIKQYNKGKLHKWGFKVLTRAGASCIIYDFEIPEVKILVTLLKLDFWVI